MGQILEVPWIRIASIPGHRPAAIRLEPDPLDMKLAPLAGGRLVRYRDIKRIERVGDQKAILHTAGSVSS